MISNRFTKSRFGVALTVVLALLANILGKYIASRFHLPLWLDTLEEKRQSFCINLTKTFTKKAKPY